MTFVILLRKTATWLATAITLFGTASCSLEHRYGRANGRDGGGYPSDLRWLTLSSVNKPLNGGTFCEEPVLQKHQGLRREVMIEPGGPIGEVEHASHH